MDFMDLITESDVYSPSISDNGNYINKIPSFNNIKNGLRCPCGSRKDKTYDSHSIFATHIKTKCHQNWLNNLNLNRSNYYTENVKLNDLVHNQRLIIGKLEKDLQNKSIIIDCLIQQMNKVSINNKTVTDLIDL